MRTQGTAILGCATSGLMGVAPERGGPFELDPSEGRGLGAGAARGEDRVAGVSLLLGRLPGCRVRAFCNLPPPKVRPRPCVQAACATGVYRRRVHLMGRSQCRGQAPGVAQKQLSGCHAAGGSWYWYCTWCNA